MKVEVGVVLLVMLVGIRVVDIDVVVVLVISVVLVRIPTLFVVDGTLLVVVVELSWSCSNLFFIHNFSKYFLKTSLLGV